MPTASVAVQDIVAVSPELTASGLPVAEIVHGPGVGVGVSVGVLVAGGVDVLCVGKVGLGVLVAVALALPLPQRQVLSPGHRGLLQENAQQNPL